MNSIINGSDFQIESGLYVIKFWATWCNPCKKMESTLLTLESEFEMMKFISVDVDQVPTLAQKYRIKTLPTLLLINNGKEIDRVTGMSLIDPLRKLFREVVKSAIDPVI